MNNPMILEGMLLLSSLSLGVFFGAQVAEAFLALPNWKSLKPEDFFDFYATYGRKIHAFFAPLTILATLFPSTTAVFLFINQVDNQLVYGIMGASSLAFFSTYFLYFKAANQRFFDRNIPGEKLALELKKWGYWHWVRLGLEFLAFASSLILLTAR